MSRAKVKRAPRKTPATAAEKSARAANLQKGHEARARRAREKAEAEAKGIHLETAAERWKRLYSGELKVSDLDDREIENMTVRSRNGTLARPRKLTAKMAEEYQREAIKRAHAMVRSAAPRAMRALLELAEDPDLKANDKIRALQLVLERSLGKAPETIRITGADKWDEYMGSVIEDVRDGLGK